MLVLSYTIQLVIPNVVKFKFLGAVVPETFVTKKFIWEKEKWTNKQGNDKHENAESLLHNTSSHTQIFYCRKIKLDK